MLEQLSTFWTRLAVGQRVTLVALLTVLVGGLVVMVWWVTRPSWAVLYSGLSPEDAAAVVEQLREQNVPYRLSAGGATIQVPYEKLYDLRLQLAGRGLPASSVVGFELFDRANFSASDLQNNINYQRALQGELERTIATMDEVVSARVHLALPEERLFTEQQQPASASVVLSLKDQQISAAQVAAIAQLVASAVPNLDPKGVTVVDTSGRVLASGWDNAGGLQTLAQLQARRAFEEGMREHLQSMLDAVVGQHRSVVRVQAELDFQSQQVSRERVESPRADRLVKREELTEESYTGQGGETGGPAGLTSTGARTVANAGGSYQHRHETREYDYARNAEQITSPPGQVKRLTVAVALDDQLEPSAETKVRDLVATAAGINPERGDQVTVESISIEALKLAEEQEKLYAAAEAKTARSRLIASVLRHAGFVLTAAMVALALLMLSRRLSALAVPAGLAHSPAPEPAPEADHDELRLPPLDAEVLRRSVEEQEAERVLAQELSSLGAEAPDSFARQLRGWINPADGKKEQR